MVTIRIQPLLGAVHGRSVHARRTIARTVGPQPSHLDGLRCYAEYTGWRGFGDWLALDGSDGL